MKGHSTIAFILLLFIPVLLSGQKKVGINTDQPQFELDVRTDTITDGADINIGNSSNSHFLRLFSGKNTDQYSNPTIYWNPLDSLILGHFGPGFTELGRLTPDGNFLLKEGGIGIGTDATSDLLEIYAYSSFQQTIVDQHYDDTPTIVYPITQTDPLAQSFTTGVTGKFIGIEIKNLIITGTLATFAQISLYDSLGPGINLLASTQVEVCDPGDIDILNPCFTNYSLGFSPIQVEPGQVFFVTIQWVSGDTLYWGNVEPGYYTGGDAWFFNGNQQWEIEPDVDFAFETYVSVGTTVKVPFIRAASNGRLHIKDYTLPIANGEHLQVMTTTASGQVIWTDKEDAFWNDPDGVFIQDLYDADVDIATGGGKIGLGINNSTDAKVHIYQDDLFNDILWLSEGASNDILKFSDNTIRSERTNGSTSSLYLQNQGKLVMGLYGGLVGIGTSSIPGDFKMAVDGKILTEEVLVQNSIHWPDYVFAKDYDLKSLSSVDEFIQTNGHLPEIPSAKEVSENGIILGEMQAHLLKKIEELTLYLIDQEKRISSLESALKSCQDEE